MIAEKSYLASFCLLLLCQSRSFALAFVTPLSTKPSSWSRLPRWHSPKEAPGSELQHADITWKLLPDGSSAELREWRLSARLAGLRKSPTNLPERAVLYAYTKMPDTARPTEVGRFGFTTQQGPSFSELQNTVSDLYGVDVNQPAKAAAIIYMVVEPEYRGRGIGALAIEAIRSIHDQNDCEYTILVADDKSVDKTLVAWYERHDFFRAPELQDVLGSPGEQFGTTMIGRTKSQSKADPDQLVFEYW